MKKNKIIIGALSIISILGISYFIYSKIKINKLNKKVTSISEAENMIKQIDISDISPEALEPVEPALPPPNEFSEQASEMEGDLVDDNWNDEGGYYYLFPDGSQDYYNKEGVLVQQRDKDHNLIRK